jgi:branched-chain amino acid transport system permease protein
MEIFLVYTILGIVTGCVYAITATGLVVTYTTTGIFNFGHGAISMFAAYSYWQLTQPWNIPQPIAILIVLLILAPAFGVVIERVLMRPMYGAPVDLTLVVTLGLLLTLLGLAFWAWDPQVTRLPVDFFNRKQFHIGFLGVPYTSIVIIIVAVGIAVALKVFFSRTRTGIAMRAVVDNPDLVAMAGGRPYRIQQLSWALGCSLAAIAGILIAPLTLNVLDINLLTLNVINGYAAAMIGRLRNLPLTVAGAIGIGLATQYTIAYAPGGQFWDKAYQIIPMIVLFGALILLPQDRLRTGSLAAPVAPKPAGLRSSLVWAVIVVVATVVIAGRLSLSNQQIASQGFALAFVLLSLVLLTGYSGLPSLCQMTFVGVGCFAVGHYSQHGSLLGGLVALLLAMGVGVLVALPTLRLRGLYLALATLAFGQAMYTVFFVGYLAKGQGTGNGLDINRPNVFGISTASNEAFLIFTSVAFVLASIGVLALRRGPYGRRLAALNDSPAACATLGVNVNWTKLSIFALSAGLAGLGGLLFGGVTQLVTDTDFYLFQSLVILLLVRIGGINTISGAFLGAMFFALFPVLQKYVPSLANLQYLLTGLGAIALARDPNGIGRRIAELCERVRNITMRDRTKRDYSSTDSTLDYVPEEDRLATAGN